MVGGKESNGTGSDWPRQLAAALSLLEQRARTDGSTLPDRFFIDAREAVRQAWASAGGQSDGVSDLACNRRHMDEAMTVTRDEAAKRLGCSLRHIGDMLADGRLHRVEGLGRSCRISVAEIEALVAGRTSFRDRVAAKSTGPGRQGQARPPLPASSVRSPVVDRAHLMARPGTTRVGLRS